MRQNINVNPAIKEFEAYMDFSGGRNTEIANERLKDNEFPEFLNVDLSGRASARLRYGRVSVGAQAGVAQGIFFFYRQGQSAPDKIMAIGGRLYVQPNGSSTITEISMTDGGSAFTFQTTRTVEAVQYRATMYIATGTKLIQLTYSSGWVAQTVTPYTPTVMEAVYIGTNGLSPNPDAYIQNGVSTSGFVEAIGIRPYTSKGSVNVPITLQAYINIPSGYAGTIDYKWEYKKSSDTTFSTVKDWTAGANTIDVNVSEATNYDFKFTARKTGDATTPDIVQQYVLPGYPVTLVADTPQTLPYVGINSCNRIILHWDRILLYGDSTNQFQMYISDLENPSYFPVDNTISYDTGKQEPVTVAVRFQDMLVVFTKTTIQTLTGKSPADYGRFLIHDGIGCVAGWTAKVVGNQVYFLSHEGFHALKPNPYRLDTMNVGRIDYQIKSEVPIDTDACAVVSDSMYFIAFPQRKIVYRFYYETGVWSKDSSDKLDIMQFLTYGDDVYNLTVGGNIYKHDSTVYTDAGEAYDIIIETKLLDLSASFNFKKLKRLYLIARSYNNYTGNLYLTVTADSAIVLTPESGHAEVETDGSVVWVDTTAPNFHFASGTQLGQWIMGDSMLGEASLSVQKASIRGKCRRVKLRFQAGNGSPFELFGFGLEFKLKKP